MFLFVNYEIEADLPHNKQECRWFSWNLKNVWLKFSSVPEQIWSIVFSYNNYTYTFSILAAFLFQIFQNAKICHCTPRNNKQNEASVY